MTIRLNSENAREYLSYQARPWLPQRLKKPNKGGVMAASDELRTLARQRKLAHQRLLDLGSKTYAAFLDMERATYCDGALTRQAKELVAVGISVVQDCRSCMQWHIGQARAAGATLRQVLEAVEVGIEMGGGPATVSARFALEAMAEAFGPEALAAACGRPS
jgi:AhpD family alkylhydroperoxidase